MPTLATDLRNKLDKAVVAARDIAEAGATAALEALAVHHHEPYTHMTPQQRALRNKLRARARQLGDSKLPKAGAGGRDHEIDHLAGECAYEHWHRMLFARFLAENNLLIEPGAGIAISLDEAKELAREDGVDVWVFASRCAQDMLPQIFRPDDPLLAVAFAREHRNKLERLLDELPAEVFTASDALGWVYQFWQSRKKDEVNKSEVKIGADEISAVTQLFTEPYMVEFLLHNTLGAWWAGKKLTAEDAASADTEDELRKKLALPGVTWDYLRFVRGEKGEGGPWRPAAGTFEGWPATVAGIKVLDPCCGSGHFLVAALHHLVPMRMAEEGLSARDAVDAVLSDNLHGLEIDERCCQIAAFALAMTAWTFPDADGYRPLPEMHIACTGIGPRGKREDWLALADAETGRSREPIRWGLGLLYDAFRDAPALGSLLDPQAAAGQFGAADYETLLPVLRKAMAAEVDEDQHEQAIAAAGMAKAAELLSGDYTLVITNVPYLGLRKMGEFLKAYCENEYMDARHDLANVMLDRIIRLVATGGSVSFVTPQAWFFAGSFNAFRHRWLTQYAWQGLARLGPGAFDGISGEVVNVALLVVTRATPRGEHVFAGIACEESRGSMSKSEALANSEVLCVSQQAQLSHPDGRVLLNKQSSHPLLSQIAVSLAGIQNGDSPMYQRKIWGN